MYNSKKRPDLKGITTFIPYFTDSVISISDSKKRPDLKGITTFFFPCVYYKDTLNSKKRPDLKGITTTVYSFYITSSVYYEFKEKT